MLLKKDQKNSARINEIAGIYVPKERRVEQKKGFCSAHFQLGDMSKRKQNQ